MASDDDRRSSRPTDTGDRGRPDVANISDMPVEEREKLVKKRRLRRKLKALAAVGLAMAAGTFVACSRMVVPRPPDAGPGDAGRRDAGREPMDGGMDANIRDATVDTAYHRDGMPVTDNLLE